MRDISQLLNWYTHDNMVLLASLAHTIESLPYNFFNFVRFKNTNTNTYLTRDVLTS